MNAGLLHPLRIGSVATRSNLVLSPMSGVTDCAFRTTVLEASGRESMGLLVSEFVAAEGLSRDNSKTIAMLRYEEVERPFSIQIFGADVDRMVRAAEMVEEVGADIVDINCGCPAPKVVRRGGGAQLMRTPETLCDIVRAVRAAVSIPVTVKIRAGWDHSSRNAVDVARMVEDEGAAMLAVHGRTRLQLYSGESDWDLIGEVHQRLSIPVIGSGDVVDAAGALARLRGGYADGVMIGRGAISNPWIFGQTLALSRGEEVREPTAVDRVEILSFFSRVLAETKELRAYVGRLRGLACHMAKGLPGGAATRRVLGKTTTAADIERIVREFLLEGRRFDDHADASHPDYGRRVRGRTDDEFTDDAATDDAATDDAATNDAATNDAATDDAATGVEPVLELAPEFCGSSEASAVSNASALRNVSANSNASACSNVSANSNASARSDVA